MVCVQAGEEFPDVRLNERERRFVRAGDSGPAQGRADAEQGSLVHFYSQATRSGMWFCGSCAD